MISPKDQNISVTIDLKWDTCISNVVAMGFKMFRILRWLNRENRASYSRKLLYFTLSQAQVRYASEVWSLTIYKVGSPENFSK